MFKIVLVVCPVMLLVIFTNYRVDPANIFSSKKYVAGIADILSKGHNVDNITNYDQRLLQEQMALRLHRPPDVLVIGSSRVMEIGADFFPGKQVLNCGVSHANINDLIALVGLFDSLHLLPRHLVINLDPDLVGMGGSLEWQSLEGYHAYFLKKARAGSPDAAVAGGSHSTDKLLSLFSFEYFKESLAFLTKGIDKRYYDVVHRQPVANGRFFDGTICYSASFSNPDTLQVANNARVTGSKSGIPPPDTAKIRLLNSMLDFLESRQVEMEFLMLPFHYEYYRAVNAHQHNLFFSYDSLFHQIASQRHIPLSGGFDENTYGIRESQFYDMFHCSKPAIQKVFPVRP